MLRLINIEINEMMIGIIAPKTATKLRFH
jgi:hypothetical protein